MSHKKPLNGVLLLGGHYDPNQEFHVSMISCCVEWMLPDTLRNLI